MTNKLANTIYYKPKQYLSFFKFFMYLIFFVCFKGILESQTDFRGELNFKIHTLTQFLKAIVSEIKA